MDERTILDMFRTRVERTPDAVAYRSKRGGAWRDRTWRQTAETAREVAAGLAACGVEAAQHVSIIANSREEWVIADLGILLAGAATVPIYQSNTGEECQYILDDSDSVVVFVENPKQLDKVRAELPKLPRITKVVVMEGAAGPSDGDRVLTWDALLALGREKLRAEPGLLDARAAAVKSESIATIVYTSGTTGRPKGVVLLHSSFVFECNAISAVIPFASTDDQLLFLPLAHIFAKVLVFASIKTGAVTSFAESVEKLLDNVAEVKPTFMGSVPRIYEKVYTKVMDDLEHSPPLKRKLAFWALDVAREVNALKQERKPVPAGLAAQHAIAKKLVLGKLAAKLGARFGGRIRWFVSGGAPLSRKIADFFLAADLVILEGYGLTETTAATHVNRPDHFKTGTVGPALPGVEIKLAEDGEVLMRGPLILREYWKKPEETREVLEPNGWFHSGDIGEIDGDGFLRITDRKKDLIKTAGGKYIAPQKLENALKTSPYVSQVLVHGDRRPFVSALFTLNVDAVKKELEAKGVQLPAGNVELAAHPEVNKLLQSVVTEANSQLAQYESIKKFKILPEDFTIDSGDLTPTLKVKRKVVSQKHKAVLDAFYGESFD